MARQISKINFEGKDYSLETGRFAKFANSVMVTCNETMVLVTVVASEKENTELDYLPLQVEYREKTASAGKFPGGFLKREGRPSEHEILCARLIDRPIRPMIPKTWHYETQIIATVFSSDPSVDADTLAAVGASSALMISDIPFSGPVSEVKVGRINGEFIANPSFDQLKNSDIDITIAGTDDSIVMVEGECKEISEDVFVSALEFAHSRIKLLNQLQNEFVSNVAKEKRAFTMKEPEEELVNIVTNSILEDLIQYVHSVTTKKERHNQRIQLYEKALNAAKEHYESKLDEIVTALPENLEKDVEEILAKLEKKEMRKMILTEGKRLDGRTLTEIRPITCEVGLLPRTHGSSLFTRGETQSLTTVTLGTKDDEQMVDGLLPVYTQPFYLHYNFPPFCTGEVGRLGGINRREIGHGNLAERALKNIVPNQTEFPYTIRVVSDILESNGSSSMATVCAGSLALFDAGVPMKKPVAGIAMGLIKEEDQIAILSDILGDEDFLGDMDFKVAGTVDGITACQMDIKIQGLSMEIMKKALEQAKQGRLHILSIMNQTIDKPRDDISPYAPRFTNIKIPTDTIGAVIGTGGETIRSIIAQTGTSINIDDTGNVLIASTNSEDAEKAVKLIQALIRKPTVGEVYSTTVVEIREGLGAIVEFLPKKQGLLHISEIAHERTNSVGSILKVGDKIDLKLIEITRDGKYRFSRKALLPRQERSPESAPKQSSEERQKPPYKKRNN